MLADKRKTVGLVAIAALGAGYLVYKSWRSNSLPGERKVRSLPVTLGDNLQVNQGKDLMSVDQSRNHVSMTFTALFRLADSKFSGMNGSVGDQQALDEIQEHASTAIATYRDFYVPKLKRQLPPEYQQDLSLVVTDENYESCIGSLKNTTGLCRFFLTKMQKNGMTSDTLLAQYLPRLEKAIGCLAFHAELKLAFGFDANNAEETAFALGYLASAAFDAPDCKPLAEGETVEGVLEALLSDEDLKKLEIPTQGNIDTRIKVLFESPHFRGHIRQLPKMTHQLRMTIRKHITALFVENHHFALMHALSSWAALGTISEHYESDTMYTSYWTFALAVLVAIRNISLVKEPPVVPEFDPATSGLSDESSWAQMIAFLFKNSPANKEKLTSSQYEHQIKCVYSCIVEAQRVELAPSGSCSEAEKEALLNSLKRIAFREIHKPSPYW